MRSTKNDTLVVLGMHRSGTSMMSAILHHLGISLGDNSSIYGPDTHNTKGYYENKSIVLCNEKLLSNKVIEIFPEIINWACIKDTTTLDSLGWILGAYLPVFSKKDCTDYTEKITLDSFLSVKDGVSRDTPVLIKDPRLSLTLPLWQNSTKIRAAIIMVRNPFSVAESLLKRNLICYELSLYLWTIYTFSALKFTEKIPKIIIDYESTIYKKNETIDSILSFLDTLHINPSITQINNAKKHIKYDMDHSIRNFPNKKMITTQIFTIKL